MFLPAGREEPLPAAFNLRLNIAYIVRIIQHEIGKPQFLVDRLLGSLPPGKLRRAPAASHGPSQSLIGGGVDKNQGIAQFVPTGFQHDRGIENGNYGSAARHFIDFSLKPAADFGMRNSLQFR